MDQDQYSSKSCNSYYYSNDEFMNDDLVDLDDNNSNADGSHSSGFSTCSDN